MIDSADPKIPYRSLSYEIYIHAILLFCYIRPVFGVVATYYFLQLTVVDAYRIIRRFCALATGIELKQIEAVRADMDPFVGYGGLFADAFYAVAFFIGLSLFGACIALIIAQTNPQSRVGLAFGVKQPAGSRRYRVVPQIYTLRSKVNFWI